MNAIKEQSKRIIDNMPEDVSYDEILKALAFDKMIKNGIQDSRDKNTVSNAEMQQKIKQW
ncbi:hypothetical protein MNB_SUP05-SYMBIONT-5-913 [hydrothermal vent metagenome]|uniref:Uncharacterized protein n=1 Tax=hydrothermal vent metagenome TaxID=652676 RepID=A0A1W1E1X5_9ZZZZ